MIINEDFRWNAWTLHWNKPHEPCGNWILDIKGNNHLLKAREDYKINLSVGNFICLCTVYSVKYCNLYY